MSTQSSDYKTRIFRCTGQSDQRHDNVHIRGECNILTEQEIYSKKGIEYMGTPPTNSIHEVSRQSGCDNNAKSSTSGWVTVYGIPNDKNNKQLVIKLFAKYGDIILVESGNGNYISFEYAKIEEAKNAVQDNPKVLFIGKDAAFVRLGRLYNEKKEEKRKEILPIHERYIEEEGDLIVSDEEENIKDSIKKFLKSLVSIIFEK